MLSNEYKLVAITYYLINLINVLLLIYLCFKIAID